jgi:hypothetical protein
MSGAPPRRRAPGAARAGHGLSRLQRDAGRGGAAPEARCRLAAFRAPSNMASSSSKNRGRPRARILATRWANRSLAISRRLGTNDAYVTLCSLANGECLVDPAQNRRRRLRCLPQPPSGPKRWKEATRAYAGWTALRQLSRWLMLSDSRYAMGQSSRLNYNKHML